VNRIPLFLPSFDVDLIFDGAAASIEPLHIFEADGHYGTVSSDAEDFAIL
jgi:hypothetical protein